MEKLLGGYINEVNLDDNKIVVKNFAGEELIGVSCLERFKREKLALRRFSQRNHHQPISPNLIGFNSSNLQITQEYIQGRTLESLLSEKNNQTTPELLSLAGKILRQIHQPIRHTSFTLEELYTKKWKKAFEKASKYFNLENIRPIGDKIDWNEVNRWGTTLIHGDFWGGNIIITPEGDIKVIDWELFGIGSPFEDFSIVELWILREHGGRHHFWKGYGKTPPERLINEFLRMKCLIFLATYKGDDTNRFYENKLQILKELN